MNTHTQTNAIPRLVLIADRFTDADVAARAKDAVRGGVPWVHLRDHEAAVPDFIKEAEAFARWVASREERVRLSVNSQLDVAEELGTGLHLGQRGPSLEAARKQLGEQAAIGFSAHDLNQGATAAAEGADYLFFSPIFPTSSKPGHEGVGLDALAAFCASVSPVPVFALGGLIPERVAACCEAGAYGVATLSAILHAQDPDWAAQHFLQALRETVYD